MEMRCRHCRQLFRAPSSLQGSEAQCPACGAVTVVEAAGQAAVEHAAAETRPSPSHSTLNRVFEPFPKMMLYVFGVLLILLILAPFWLSDFGDRMKGQAVVISDDDIDLPPPLPTPVKEEPAPAPVPVEVRESALDHYAGVSLNTTRDALQERYQLHLKNTRGMRPEIYEAGEQEGWKKATFNFYSNELKEFTIVHPERSATPLAIVRELKEKLGEPSDWGDERDGKGLVGADVPGGIRNPEAITPNRDEPWQAYPYRQQLTWYERDNRVTATIYYTSKEPVDCVAVLAVHVSDDAWLINRRPRLTSEGESESPLLMQPMEPAPVGEEPKRLFPE